MKKQFVILGLSIFLGSISVDVKAQTHTSISGSSNFVTTAVPFLRISPDARAGAMGDAGIAVSPDANAQYWNVGKLPFADKNFAFSATYTPWLKDLVPDIYLAYLSLYGKFGTNNENCISASMRYFSLGNINYTTSLGDPNGTGMPREYSFDLGYSRKLSDNLGIGLSGRYIHSAIASGVSYVPGGGSYSPGNAVSTDVGLFYTKRTEAGSAKAHTLSFGAVASNLGSKISYNSTRKDFIPMNLGVGVAYTVDVDDYNSFTGTLDLNKLLVPIITGTGVSSDTQVSVVSGIFNSFKTGDQLKEIDASLGLEWWYQHQFGVRAGYFYEDPTNGDRQYFTCGLGVKYNVFQLNASYLIPQGNGITRNPLSNTLRFSLIFEFDKFPKAAQGKDTDTATPTTE